MNKTGFPFDRSKYTLLLVGLVVVILGFVLMSGGGSDDPNEFSEAIFSARRITVAPLLVMAGYGVIMYAILKKHAPAVNESDSKA